MPEIAIVTFAQYRSWKSFSSLQAMERIPCKHCDKRYKNSSSMWTHVSRAHRPSAQKLPPGAVKRKASSASASKKPVKSPCANRKRYVSPAKKAEARAQEQLSSALRVQHAYRMGSEVGKAKIVAAQAEVASLEQSNRLLESKLRAAERSIAYRTSLLGKARDERDDLKTENMCVCCWDRQRCALLLPCAHYPLCEECLDGMKHRLEVGPLKCPMCSEEVMSDLKLSPGALPGPHAPVV